MVDFSLKSGILYDVIGRCRTGKNYVFVPVLADGDLSCLLQPNHSLDAYLNSQFPPAIQLFEAEGQIRDAVWTRARISAEFEFDILRATPKLVRPTLLDVVFAAFPRPELEKVSEALLVCCNSDEEFGAGILFFDPRPHPEIEVSIAQDFWDLLLSNPEKTCDFVDYVSVGEDYDQRNLCVSWTNGTFQFDEF